MRSLLTYTAARLGLFAAAFGVVYLFGARAWIALILAWLVSGLASYVLLSGMRDKVSASAVERMERRRANSLSARLSDASAREDGFQEAPDREETPAGAEADAGAGEDRAKAKPGEDAPTAARES
ncbi:DUF4229 domain-containing protein [Nocardiopsis dassonvillei]|uniref:DUF4229 domain-containing protein n=1 Tax=Nocardiopsis dassonvillei TaxID=2014 RepID=UPI0036355284